MSYFGTDGIRGEIGRCDKIHPQFLMHLGWALGQYIRQDEVVKSKLVDGVKPKVFIGKDTRISGYMLESALESGLISAGIDIYLLGPMPTAAIAYLTRTFKANAGIVISASHNPFYDNGIKVIDGCGRKISKETQIKISGFLDQSPETVESYLLGKAYRLKGAPERYIEFCKSVLTDRSSLSSFKVVLDCANGASYHIAPSVFDELGAQCHVLFNRPNGVNINLNCGSTNPYECSRQVVARQASLGICLDGDGDRMIPIDDQGRVLTGDHVLYVLAKYLKATNRLSGGVVGTIMTNVGLEQALKSQSIDFKRVAVGDQHIVKEMLASGWNLGGEPSGHTILSDIFNSGDGILTALMVMEALNYFGGTLSELLHDLKMYPSQLVNLPWQESGDLDYIQTVASEVQQQYLENGRILIRPSGTEPLLRVLIEAETKAEVTHAMKHTLAKLSELVTT